MLDLAPYEKGPSFIIIEDALDNLSISNLKALKLFQEDTPELFLNKVQTKEGIETSFKGLTKVEVRVIKRRYGIGMKEETYKEIARIEKMTPGKIRQIEAKALRKLRHPELSKQLKEVL